MTDLNSVNAKRHGVHDTELAHGQGERVHEKARKDGENPSCLKVVFSKAS